MNFLLGSIGARSKRVKWNTKLEHEYINNFKVLQEYFKALNVEKVDFNAVDINIYIYIFIYLISLSLVICALLRFLVFEEKKIFLYF